MQISERLISKQKYRRALPVIDRGVRIIGSDWEDNFPVNDDTIFAEGAARVAIKKQDFKSAAHKRYEILRSRLAAWTRYCRRPNH
jgi:hypothetical protein